MDVARPIRRSPRTARGFSLMELLTAIAIVAIVSSIAVPGLLTMVRNSRLSAVSNDLLASLQNARTESVKRQTQTVVCWAADTTATTPTCSYGAGAAWIVFQDTNGNWQHDANEPLLERHDALDATLSVKTAGQSVIAFNATGFATPTALFNRMTNAVFCDKRGVVALGASSTARAVVISATGRARVANSLSDVLGALNGVACP